MRNFKRTQKIYRAFIVLVCLNLISCAKQECVDEPLRRATNTTCDKAIGTAVASILRSMEPRNN